MKRIRALCFRNRSPLPRMHVFICLYFCITERVMKIFKEMERAVNQYESALASFSKKASSPQRSKIPKPNGLFGKLGNYAMTLFGPASETAASGAQPETQTATSTPAVVTTQVPKQDTKKKNVSPRRIPKVHCGPSRIINEKHIVAVRKGVCCVLFLRSVYADATTPTRICLSESRWEDNYSCVNAWLAIGCCNEFGRGAILHKYGIYDRGIG